MVITHVRTRQVTVEVGGRDRTTCSLTVASGFGPDADWSTTRVDTRAQPAAEPRGRA
jgi:hypothetical protein